MEDTVFAPMYWGFVASIFLAGITVVQAYSYFPNSHNDRPLVRWTAVCMLITDLASTALIAQSIYYYLIPEFGSFTRFGSVTPELTVECLISTTITFISQLYFVHQLVSVKRAGKGSLPAIWVTLVSAVLGFGGGVGCVATMFKYHKNVLAGDSRSMAFYILFIMAKGWASIADIVATAAMCMWLTHSRTGIKETNTLLSKLMRFVVQRGILVTTIQVLLLVTFTAVPHSLAWFALHMNVTKLYANTFFAMLNGRHNLRDNQGKAVISSFSVSTTGGHHEPIRSLNVRAANSVQDSEGYAMEKRGHENNNAQQYTVYSPPSKESREFVPVPVPNRYYNMPTITKTVVVERD